MSDMVSGVMSYYLYVKHQCQTVHAQVFINGHMTDQPFAGVVDAQDWPQAPIVEGGLYLLVLGLSPGLSGTPGQNEYTAHLQWVWELIGTDIAAGQVGQNRGDRFRANMQVMENLRQAHFPGFSQKLVYSADQVTGALTATAAASTVPFSPYESIRWTLPRFVPRSAASQSGLIFGAAEVDLTAYGDVLSALA